MSSRSLSLIASDRSHKDNVQVVEKVLSTLATAKNTWNATWREMSVDNSLAAELEKGRID